MKQKYHINKKWKGHYGETIHFNGNIEIDNLVIDAVDGNWRAAFYPELDNPHKIASHIAFNMIVNDLTLSHIDGFADLSDDLASIVRE